MQQVFFDEEPQQSLRNHFPLATELVKQLPCLSSRKRARADGSDVEACQWSEEGDDGVRTRAVAWSSTCLPVVQLPSETERSLLQLFLEYGQYYRQPTTLLQREALRRSHPAQLLNASGRPLAAATSPEQNWRAPAIRRALSLVCRVVAADASGYFLRSPVPSHSSTKASSGGNGGDAAPAAEVATSTPDSFPSQVTLLELYYRLQALELEYEDLVVATQVMATNYSGGGSGAAPAAQQAHTLMEEVARCIDDVINSLEETLLRMLIPDVNHIVPCPSPSSPLSPSSPTAASSSPPLAYVADLLRKLPSLLEAEDWPGQLCGSTPEPTESPLGVEHHLFSPTDGGRPSPPFHPRSAITAIILKALQEVRQADVCSFLGSTATSSPISRIAALQAQKTKASSDSRDIGKLPHGRVFHLERLEFTDILASAWNQEYDVQGLRRVQWEVELWIFKTLSSATSRRERRDILLLWTTWLTALRRHYDSFLSHVSTTEAAGPLAPCFPAALSRTHALVRLRSRACAANCCSAVQSAALRVVSKLQAVDGKGWFAVPAFDMVNVDFGSIRHWIQSPSFAVKSKRDAYRSLCRVMEGMVDCCVEKYGPTHAFSDLITRVRQQLVDVARGEGLL